MRNRTPYPLILLVLTFLVLTISGCKKQPDTVRATLHTEEAAVYKLIKKHVEDDLRQEQLLHLVDQNRSALREIKLAFFDMTDQMRANPKLTREEMTAIGADFKATREVILDEMAVRLIEMRKYATEEEWNSIQAGLKKKRAKKAEKMEKEAEKKARKHKDKSEEDKE